MLFGKIVFVYAIKCQVLRLDHHYLSEWALNAMTGIPLRNRREGTGSERGKKQNMKIEAEIAVK